MSRTNSTTPLKHWNVEDPGGAIGLYSWHDKVGTELYDLRFYAGCKRTPEVIHRSLVTRGTYCSKIYANQRRRVVRTAEREYVDAVRDLWNAGEDVDDKLEPADNRHGAVLWDIW